MRTRAVHMANGLISCALAVRRVRSERGVVTLRNERRRRSFNTDTAAPVSISARVATPSTVTSITLAGERGRLRNFDGAAVLASGSQPLVSLSCWILAGTHRARRTATRVKGAKAGKGRMVGRGRIPCLTRVSMGVVRLRSIRGHSIHVASRRWPPTAQPSDVSGHAARVTDRAVVRCAPGVQRFRW